MQDLQRPTFIAALCACVVSITAWINTRTVLNEFRMGFAAYVVPKDLVQTAGEIRETAEDPKHGAAFDVAALKALRDRLDACETALTLPQRQMLARELERASWALEVRNIVLDGKDQSVPGLLARRLVGDRLHSEAPANAPGSLKQELEDLRSSGQEQAEMFIAAAANTERARLLALSQQLFGEPTKPKPEIAKPSDTLGDAEVLVEGWGDDPKLANARRKLEQVVRLHEALDAIGSWQKRRDEAVKLAGVSERLTALAVLAQELDVLRDEWRGVTDAEFSKARSRIDEWAKNLAADQKAANDQARRAYQEYALEQLDLFAKAWNSGKKSVGSVTTYLLPIDENFLERPVAQIFQDDIQLAWGELKGDRFEIAKGSVTAVKKTPEDILAEKGTK